MSISVNGQSQVPPGFRFHPTEEELLQYYLKKKVALEKIDLDVIQDVDLNKLEPWDIQEKCKIGTTPQNDWYFFSHKDKKYPTGTRTNRATSSGFWKATGRDKVIYGNSKRIGMRKTLVFYKGRAPHGQKSDWIMHEYRLDDNTTPLTPSKHVYNAMGGGQEEGWVICRVFKKKNLCTQKTPEGSPVSTTTWSVTSLNPCNEAAGTLEQMLQSIDTQSRRNQFLEAENRRFLKLPSLYDSPRYEPAVHVAMLREDDISDHPTFVSESETGIGIQDWAALDRLVASHLNGPTDTPKHLPNFMSTSHDHMRMSYCSPVNENHDQMVRLHHNNKSSSSSSSTRAYPAAGNDYDENEADLWNFPVSSNDQLCQLSNLD